MTHVIDITNSKPVCPCCGNDLVLTASKRLGRPTTTFYIGLSMGLAPLLPVVMILVTK